MDFKILKGLKRTDDHCHNVIFMSRNSLFLGEILWSKFDDKFKYSLIHEIDITMNILPE